MKVSIIIPVLNEAQNLSRLLPSLQMFRRHGHEIIVVDGGSSDDSFSVAQQGADQSIISRAGRAIQMNCGASIASGDLYLFLHADSQLPDDAMQLLGSLAVGQAVWGRFDVRLSSPRIIYRCIEGLMNWRSRLTAIATGDQAIFIERQLFDATSGYPEISLMEDIAISRLLRQQCAPVCMRSRVITSSRRWESRGVISTVLLMWKLRLYYFLGVSPDRLSRLYR